MIQTSAKVLAGIAFEELRRSAVCVAMHPAHPLARARKVSLERVAKERLVGYTLRRFS
jgi:DNA-binding transcriptional LysR family regulator